MLIKNAKSRYSLSFFVSVIVTGTVIVTALYIFFCREKSTARLGVQVTGQRGQCALLALTFNISRGERYLGVKIQFEYRYENKRRPSCLSNRDNVTDAFA